MQVFKNDLNYAKQLDHNDSLKAYRNAFFIPQQKNGRDAIYLAGHSLGLQPKHVPELVNAELTNWARLGVSGHFTGRNPWLHYHELVSEALAKIVGAKPAEVIAMNSLTVNLHLMMVTFYRPTSTRYAIMMEANPFSSDRYAVQSQLQWHGITVEKGLMICSLPIAQDYLSSADIINFIKQHGHCIATILMSGVNYLNGQLYDLAAITHEAHRQGCLVGFDLAHAVGNVPLQLHAWEVDFAVWCSYKYLNAGPGAIGGCFIHERHLERHNVPRFSGWWGHDKQRRFQMETSYKPIPTAEGWQLSNPPILQLAALRGSLQLFAKLGMEKIRQKSAQMTAYLLYLLTKGVEDKPFLEQRHWQIITPDDPDQRGSQISLRLLKHDSKKVVAYLNKRGIICDERSPDILRMAPVAFYNRYEDIYRFVTEFLQYMAK